MRKTLNRFSSFASFLGEVLRFFFDGEAFLRSASLVGSATGAFSLLVEEVAGLLRFLGTGVENDSSSANAAAEISFLDISLLFGVVFVAILDLVWYFADMVAGGMAGRFLCPQSW